MSWRIPSPPSASRPASCIAPACLGRLAPAPLVQPERAAQSLRGSGRCLLRRLSAVHHVTCIVFSRFFFFKTVFLGAQNCFAGVELAARADVISRARLAHRCTELPSRGFYDVAHVFACIAGASRHRRRGGLATFPQRLYLLDPDRKTFSFVCAAGCSKPACGRSSSAACSLRAARLLDAPYASDRFSTTRVTASSGGAAEQLGCSHLSFSPFRCRAFCAPYPTALRRAELRTGSWVGSPTCIFFPVLLLGDLWTIPSPPFFAPSRRPAVR